MQWAYDEFVQLRDLVTGRGAQVLLDLASERLDSPVFLSEVVEKSRHTRSEVNAHLAVMSGLVKRVFGRANWPLQVQLRTDSSGARQSSYTLEPQLIEELRRRLVQQGPME